MKKHPKRLIALVVLALILIGSTIPVLASGQRTTPAQGNSVILVKDSKGNLNAKKPAKNKLGFTYYNDASDYTGFIKYDGKTYYVRKGKADTNYTGLVKKGSSRVLVSKGVYDSTKNGWYHKKGSTWLINNGKVVEPTGNKVIYLTFDDGPGPYTSQLLDVLKKNHVKATFFVTAQYGKNRGCIKRAYNEGNSIAVHTYSHNYANIYSSTDAYWNDFNKMNQVIKDQTGTTSTLFRFPGGSSNTVSRSYSKGVMTRLSKQAAEKGYVYFDWNVVSGDAGQTTSSNGVYSNITRGVKNHSRSVVLCHDIKPYTVNAMDKVIKWGLKNGYTFLPLNTESYTAHQSIAN